MKASWDSAALFNLYCLSLNGIITDGVWVWRISYFVKPEVAIVISLQEINFFKESSDIIFLTLWLDLIIKESIFLISFSEKFGPMTTFKLSSFSILFKDLMILEVNPFGSEPPHVMRILFALFRIFLFIPLL